MPFIDVRLAGQITREQKAAIVGDLTRSMVDRLGKSPNAVQINITELDLDNYGAGGRILSDAETKGAAQADGSR